ncbi:hypothetical protein COCC4DRAFT_127886 [Bipolaris maydis ATCC 48331]|uniref:AB hydrolase-1 domain-containing protein n=2 Tax=Cochliobolus heterostrophus TaxID=5016 RepID=M2TV23_COCH5|nr:uncharacterized protein COCC4DRAFT_127886 [Bipolaris maydis ATCC 48331]EMD90354.1 hypothetical protein COCHEDRAFT_1031672 [Bipolaris maydis C5]KAJ5023810.1 Alpha/beta hydrolase fold-1 [Bipolaris maydis]ENI09433.1 hypothetical protein COCC4DRAFT_127886 [Bipolaris maydis ATCC 48331]KAJ5058245.1 Alpha/beta hydrolase fold-1 [Bipolaris maydis]KAJ6195492.1 Alpha/beta hydrolase fold-1 [Bipolaris maydis]
MAITSKPTILLVPGAWMPSDCFGPLRHMLAEEGYETVAVNNPSVGSEPADQTLDTDVAALRKTLERLIEQEGKDVILFLHSYGGVVGSCASEGFGAKQRASEGKKGGITEIIYCTAFALKAGESLLAKLGGKMSPWMRVEGSKVYIDSTPEDGFPDLPEAEQKKWHGILTHTAAGVFSGASTYEPWHHIPCAYFICDNDTLLVPPIQEAMANSIGATIQRNTGSHSPFLSVPDQLVKGIKAVLGESR